VYTCSDPQEPYMVQHRAMMKKLFQGNAGGIAFIADGMTQGNENLRIPSRSRSRRQ
jgi:hypothetical protein